MLLVLTGRQRARRHPLKNKENHRARGTVKAENSRTKPHERQKSYPWQHGQYLSIVHTVGHKPLHVLTCLDEEEVLTFLAWTTSSSSLGLDLMELVTLLVLQISLFPGPISLLGAPLRCAAQ